MKLLTDRLAARLSRGRRGRYAGAVVLLLGLLVSGGAYAVVAPAQATDEAADQSTIDQGRALFLVGCASCHGKNGEGVTLQNGNQYGPPLAGVGAAAVDFQVSTGRMPLARPGVQAPVKDVVYTEEEISQLAALGLPAIVALRDLGPAPGTKLERTVWTKGMRIVNDVSGTPIKPGEVEIGQLINAEPAAFFETDEEGEPLYEGVRLQQEKTKAAIIVVRMRPEDITPSKGRENWGYDGILCYSKICTHVGCPISLWEQQTHHLLCPCHQSTFDLADNGVVVFGPAARALPQLPLMLDDEGYLVAQSDFTEPVGPSYWERG